MKFNLQHFAAKTIWWDAEDRTYVCATAVQVTSDVAAFAAASRDNGRGTWESSKFRILIHNCAILRYERSGMILGTLDPGHGGNDRSNKGPTGYLSLIHI